MVVELGQKAPDVELFDSERKRVKISDFEGRKTILAFFPGAFTSVCTREMCTFRDSSAALNAFEANVVGISVDSPAANKAFKEQHNLNFQVLSDYNREAVKAFGISLENFANMPGYTAAKRAVFILDKAGNVRFRWVSDNPGVEPDYKALMQELEKVN